MKIKIVLRALLLGLWLCMVCNSANAIVLNNLYSVNLNVADNSTDTRNKQLPLALEEVLLKVGSSKTVLDDKELAVAKQQVDKYVNGYSYKQDDELYKLTVQFNDKMISQLLTKLGRSHLSNNRPLIVLQLMDDGTHADLVAKLDALSNRYGIPMVVPLLDLSEINVDAAHVGEIASRYRADVVMSGKIINLADEWHCTWRLFSSDGSDRVATWSSNGTDLDAQLELMFNNLAEQLAARYKDTGNTKEVAHNKISIRVGGVANLTDYAKITAYLKNLAPIKKLEVKSVLENEVVFLISSDGGKEAVSRAIAQDRLLTVNVPNTDSEALSYKVNL